jgi:CHAT domain-containing protein
MGVIRLRQGRFSEALSQYRVAVRNFERVREQENLGAVHGMVAENLKLLGQDVVAWRHRYRSIALLTRYPKSMRLHNALWEAGAAALENDEPEAALLLQNEGLLVARRSGDPGMVAEALLRRSKIQMALGASEAAGRDLEEARQLNSRFEDRDIREKLDADIWYAEGKLLSATAPEQALNLLSAALDYYQDHDLSLELVQAYLSRALIRRAAGQQREEEEDLARAFEVFERQRENLADDAMQASYSEAVQELFDETIWMWARKGRAEQALETSERARILPHAKRSKAPPANFSAALSEIPEDLVFVEYALLRDRLLTWIVRQGRIDLIDRPVQPEALEMQVRAFVSVLRSNASVSKINEASIKLNELLIPAEVRALPKAVELCFIPDKILNAVPFAALKGKEGGYLVEKHPVAVASSITQYLRISSDAVAARKSPASALLVGATVFDRSLFNLQDLPGAQEEIQEIQQLYPGAQVMLGEDVTRPQILEAMGRHEVFQFSGHGIFNPRYPNHSYFVVAPLSDRTDTGMVFAHEIAGRDLSQLRLVVLSACDSLGPLATRMTAFSGMARPFLEAGVSAVLGTLWKVDDRASATLIPGFHRKFLQEGDCSTALRFAQLEMLRDPEDDFRSPAIWSSFVCVSSPGSSLKEI